ncbi:hypothetical protein L2E82_33679 [Cichorium intybus]|uniref:Uncharacterized protein n=1 Tax=Cichorium intybus TaxID=13427 RepID=A0ACB9BKV3_CICIN|nr:hypothetical protein L2E82_33679 [Cichorium intybus]
MKRPTVEQETVAEKKRESENQIKIRYPKGIKESYDTVTPNSTSSSLKRNDLGIGNYESLIEERIISAMVHLTSPTSVLFHNLATVFSLLSSKAAVAAPPCLDLKKNVTCKNRFQALIGPTRSCKVVYAVKIDGNSRKQVKRNCTWKKAN